MLAYTAENIRQVITQGDKDLWYIHNEIFSLKEEQEYEVAVATL